MNLTTIARELEGYSGSDIKEVCREAVVRVAHERAIMLEKGEVVMSAPPTIQVSGDGVASSNEGSSVPSKAPMEGSVAGAGANAGVVGAEEVDEDAHGPLRPVSARDFKDAMKKLKASVDESGRELQKVAQWNDKYGEIKRKSTRKSTAYLSMYL